MTAIEMVPVATLLKNISYTADRYRVGNSVQEWFRMLREKMDDWQTPAIIRAIETQGFTDPICITKISENDWELGNGHHRLCVAILLGLDKIPVDFSDWYSNASTTNEFRISNDYREGDLVLAEWISDTVARMVE